MTIAEHDVVVLTRDLPAHNLKAGDVGAVVHIYGEAKAYAVEFVTDSGQTIAVETLAPGDVRALGAQEILHARDLPAASQGISHHFSRSLTNRAFLPRVVEKLNQPADSLD